MRGRAYWHKFTCRQCFQDLQNQNQESVKGQEECNSAVLRQQLPLNLLLSLRPQDLQVGEPPGCLLHGPGAYSRDHKSMLQIRPSTH